MKKRLGLLILCGFTFMGLAACKQSEAGAMSDGDVKTENLLVDLEEIEVKKTEYGTKETMLKGNKLDKLTLTGIDDAFYCNLKENIKWENGGENTPVLVCKDPVYDITYYVNYGRDYYIYACRDGKKELAVAVSARDLFCKDGELYFIADNYGCYQFSDFAQGNILKYNPKDGSVSVVVDCSAESMIVYQDGICYRQIGGKSEIMQNIKYDYFFYSFDTGCSSPQNVRTLRRWNGYVLDEQQEIQWLSESDPLAQQFADLGYTGIGLGTAINGINLVDIQGEVKESIQNVKGISNEYWIGDNSLYYVTQRKNEGETDSKSVLRRYDMNTGEHEDMAVLGYPIFLSASDMIICNGVVYFEGGLRVNLDSGEQCYMTGADNSEASPKHFYTDGENIFCVGRGKLWLFEEQQGGYTIEKEFVAGVLVKIGTYVYHLCEP